MLTDEKLNELTDALSKLFVAKNEHDLPEVLIKVGLLAVAKGMNIENSEVTLRWNTLSGMSISPESIEEPEIVEIMAMQFLDYIKPRITVNVINLG